MKLIRIFRDVISLSILLSIGFSASAQLSVDMEMDPTTISQNLVGEGIEIFDALVIAADSSYGYYESIGTEIGNSQGLLITTGKAENAMGPNDESGLPQLDGVNCLTCDYYDNEFMGSTLISDANGGLQNWDACHFQFDFVPQGDTVRFDYSFASEEYIEWVGSNFNDAFGFFITGPGIGTDVNVALIPGTSTSVAINNVNHIDNSEFFYHNEDPDGLGIQYDGFTVNTFVEFPVTSCETYTIKLIVADGTDRMYDSGVFISELSSNPITIETATAEGLDYMIEGCNDGTVSFVSPFINDDDTSVIFTIDGSATLGVDYTTDPDISLFYDALNDVYEMIIPAGEESVGFDVNTIVDGIEGIEFIEISLLEQYCDAFIFNSLVEFEIHDEIPIELTPTAAEICPNQEVQLIGVAETMGNATFSWSPEEGLDDPNSLTPIASPEVTTTYTLTSTIGACESSLSSTITITTLDLVFDVTNINCSEGGTGAIDLTITNGVDPYTYNWIGPGDYTSSDEDLTEIGIGEYCVNVIDANGCGTSACISVIEESVLTINLDSISTYNCNNISCNGLSDGMLDISVLGGSGDYTFLWSNDEITEDLMGIPAGTYTVTVTDVDGCQESISYVLTEPEVLTISLVDQNDLLCDGTTTGSIEVTATGGCPIYEYNWSHDPILDAELATNLGTGEYVVSVTDNNGCNSVDSVDVFINPPIDPLNVTIDLISIYPGGFNISCPLASDGSIDITISGGTSAYDILWTDDNGNTYTDEDLIGIECGTYDLLVIDANGCEFMESVTLTCVPDIQVEYTTVQNPCDNPTAMIGEIHITNVSGGQGGPYITSWLSGPSCPCIGDDLTGLDVGVYVYQVIDLLGCIQQFPITIGLNDEFVVEAIINDESCYDACDGSIDLTITPADVESTVWTYNGDFYSNDTDLTDLCAGSYIVTITNGACEESFSYTIEEAPEIFIDIVNLVQPTCVGNEDGSIEIAVSGGVGALDVMWLANADCDFLATSDLILNGLGACDYTVEVTDDNMCVATLTVTMDSVQAITVFTQVSPPIDGFDVACFGDESAEITVNVSGGTPDCVLFDPFCYGYDWSAGDDVTVFGNSNDVNFVTVGAGTYTIIVTDANGCTGEQQVTITEPEVLQSTPFINDIVCNGEMTGSIDPNISGGSGIFVLYEWTGPIGTNSPNATILTGLGEGTYELTVTDSNDCVQSFTYQIIENPEITITLDSSSNVTCFGLNNGTIAITASGGNGTLDITWTGPGSPSGTVLTGLEPGIYTVTATDEVGCTTSLVVECTEPEILQINFDLILPNDSAMFNIACMGDSTGGIFSNVSGGTSDYSYTWEDCEDNFLSNDADIFNLPAGCYSLFVEDMNGCTTEMETVITEPELPLSVDSEISLYPNELNISCFNAMDGFINLDVTGGVPDYIYVWELNTELFDFNEDQANLDEGLYEVLVTDANSCDTLLSFQIIQPPELFINASVGIYGGGFNVSCADSCNGTIEINPNGGMGDLEIDWGMSVLDSLLLEDLCADIYSLTVTDTTGCSVQQIFTIEAPEPIVFEPIIIDFPCPGDGDITIAPIITGGVGSYDYLWTPNGEVTPTIIADENGNYCVDVTDENDCMASNCWAIVVPEPMQVESTITDATCGECNGAVDLEVSGGNLPYDYSWGTEDQTDLCPDSYNVTITDDSDCAVDIILTVGGSPELVVTESIINLDCNGAMNGEISLSITGGEDPIEVIWFDNVPDQIGTGNSIDNLDGGSYSATINWGDGCIDNYTYGIGEPSALFLDGFSPEDAFGFNVTIEGGMDGSIETEVSGGTPDYDYFWDGPTDITDGTEDPEMLGVGTYTLTVIDDNGCSMDTTFTLTGPSGLGLPNGMTPNGDGANDFYVINGVHLYPDNTFTVFNRWGNIVYNKFNYNNEWNGSNNDGEPLPNGTYFVVFEADDLQLETFVDLRR